MLYSTAKLQCSFILPPPPNLTLMMQVQAKHEQDVSSWLQGLESDSLKTQPQYSMLTFYCPLASLH